jgi:hypothetical protein
MQELAAQYNAALEQVRDTACRWWGCTVLQSTPACKPCMAQHLLAPRACPSMAPARVCLAPHAQLHGIEGRRLALMSDLEPLKLELSRADGERGAVLEACAPHSWRCC